MNAQQRKAQRDKERTEFIKAGIRAMLKIEPWPHLHSHTPKRNPK